jgi:hypothetical protein
MQHAILAILSGHEQSTRCADALKLAGFTGDEISILLPDEFGAQELGFARKTRAAEGLVVGVIAGAILGAGFALVANNAQVSIHEVNVILGAGPMVAALAMATVFAVILGFLCMLVGMSMTEFVVRKYDRKTRFTSSLIAIHADNTNEMRIVEKILKLEGAQDIRTMDEETDRRKPIQLAAH